MFYAVCVELTHQHRVHAGVQAAQTHQGRQRHCHQKTHLKLELRNRNSLVSPIITATVDTSDTSWYIAFPDVSDKKI